MAFEIRASPLALADIDESIEYYVREGSPRVAAKWLNGIVAAVHSLQDMPKRCPLAAESDDLEFEVRQILYKSRRVVFHVEDSEDGGTVHVLRVYHQSRRALSDDDLN